MCGKLCVRSTDYSVLRTYNPLTQVFKLSKRRLRAGHENVCARQSLKDSYSVQAILVAIYSVAKTTFLSTVAYVRSTLDESDWFAGK